MLFEGDEHEPLSGSDWDEQWVRSALDLICLRTRDAFEPGQFWPRDPLDDYGSRARRDKGLWIGAAGVLWALERLGAGVGEADVYDAYLGDPDVPGSTGLMQGETGVLLVSWKLAPTPEKEARLFELVEGNIHNPSHELFNGAPGAMLAALHVYETTGSPRWRELWRRCAAAVWEQFRVDPELGCRLWIQYRRGRLLRSVGAGHGFASNVRSLLRGRELLGDEMVQELETAGMQTACRLAVRESGLVNWPTAADAYWAEQFPIRVQWCHGAPGMITSLWSLPREPQLDAALHDAGELIWTAGPLRRAPASVTALLAMGTRCSRCTLGSATRSGGNAPGHLLPTPSPNLTRVTHDTRSGPETSASRSTSTPAWTASPEFLSSTCSSQSGRPTSRLPTLLPAAGPVWHARSLSAPGEGGSDDRSAT